MKNWFVIFFCISLFFLSCTQNGVPLEKGYPRVYLPKKSYKKYTSDCGYSFELPKYAYIENKDYFMNQRLKSDSCWINVVFPDFNGKLHISYKYFNDSNVLFDLLEDSYRLTSKHTVRASYIKDSIIDKPNLKGLIYSVGGNAASAKQFILTDRKHQFLRGSLYFESTPNADSMAPVLSFITSDVLHFINTFSFHQ
jgi:gliding motility-associated lipoprotein GldD